jgi:hypothetical protein
MKVLSTAAEITQAMAKDQLHLLVTVLETMRAELDLGRPWPPNTEGA